jgi:hypothetical protein
VARQLVRIYCTGDADIPELREALTTALGELGVNPSTGPTQAPAADTVDLRQASVHVRPDGQGSDGLLQTLVIDFSTAVAAEVTADLLLNAWRTRILPRVRTIIGRPEALGDPEPAPAEIRLDEKRTAPTDATRVYVDIRVERVDLDRG